MKVQIPIFKIVIRSKIFQFSLKKLRKSHDQMTTMVDAASSDIERAEELKTLANEAFKGNCLGFRMQIYDV